MTSKANLASPVRVAFLGAGDWAQQYHLPALKALGSETPVEIVGIWNRTPARARQAAGEFNVARIYRSLDEAINDEQVNCFVVVVSSSALMEIVNRLLVRRLPIFSEKPSGSCYREAAILATTVDVPNVVAFNRRYMPINRRFKQLAAAIEGAYFAECHFYRHARNYDQFVMETGVHGINYMEYLCGAVRKIRTERHTLGQSDFWLSSVTFASGMQGIFKFLPCSGSSVERYEVHGADTSIYLHCPQTYATDHPGKIFVHEKGKALSTIEDDESGGTLVTAGLLDEYRDFFAAVRGGAASASNFANACNTMRVAEAIEDRRNNGREFVFS